MSPSQPERIYGVRELTRILTLTPKRAGQLRRLELLRGDSGYTFRDLLALRAASALLDAGASVRQIRTALTALRRQSPDLQQPLAEIRLVLEGDRLVAQSDRVRFDPRTGQMVLALDSGGLEAAATATLATGLVGCSTSVKWTPFLETNAVTYSYDSGSVRRFARFHAVTAGAPRPSLRGGPGARPSRSAAPAAPWRR